MRKLVRTMVLCGLAVALIWTYALLRDKKLLREELIRFHVVANSDSQEDQNIKIQIRDVIMEDLSSHMSGITDVTAAKEYLRENLPRIRAVANEALRAMGVDMEAAVTLTEEAFDRRVYDTFTLPAGMYQALRITIGSGEGKNWWCVVFPAFCMGAVSEDFQSVAVDAGLSEELTETLTGKDGYKVRFFFLEKLGELEMKYFAG